jgi:hypothetical protein
MINLATRRNVGMWLFPASVVLVLLLEYSNGLVWNLYVWSEISTLVGFSVVLIGPCIAAATAWMVARERRCSLEELLITTPSPPFNRWAAVWLGSSIWGVLAYGITAGVLIVLAARTAVWGGPTLWPMVIGVLAIPAYAAVGCAAGAFFPGRSTGPLTAIGALLAEVVAGRFGRNIDMPFLSYLSPVGVLNTSVWYGVRPNVAVVQSLMLLGLTGLGLGAVAWRADAQKHTRALLAAGALLVATSVGVLIAHAPPSWQTLRDQVRVASGIVGKDRAVVPYTPACTSTGVTVCMHPAYRPFLQGDAATIRRLLEPLSGIAGAPARAAQSPGWQGVSNGALEFILTNLPPDDPSMPANLAKDQSFFGPIILSLVRTRHGAHRAGVCPGDTSGRSCDLAQEAIGIWLVRRAGLRVTAVDSTGATSYPYVGHDLRQTVAAARRFAALPAMKQRAWLRRQYVALRQGRVSIAELP